MHHVGRAAHALAGLRALFAVFEVVRKLDDRVFAHAEHHAVRTGGFEDGRHNAVGPVVVMREAAQTGFDAAEIYRRIRERAARQHGINGDGAIRALAAHTAGRVGIIRAAFFCGGVVRDHRVDVAAVDEHRIARTAHLEEVVLIAKIRLAEDGDLVAGILQHARNDGRAERRVIDIRIARYDEKIAVIPPAIGHILFGNREKTVHRYLFYFYKVKWIQYNKNKQSGKTYRRLTTLLRRRWYYGSDLADHYATYSA